MNAKHWPTAALAVAALSILAACGDDDGDACDGVACDPPAASCEGDVAVSYTGAGLCVDGGCDYAAVRTTTDCAAEGQVCLNGDCVEPAECTDGADCTPPAAFCDGQTAVSYAGNGTCSEAGTCDYSGVESSVDCTAQGQVCLDGACVEGEACTESADCDSPPADTCDGDTVMAYAATGTCSDQGVCEYTASAGEDCAASDLMCVAGTCSECAVDTDCTTPPPAECGADSVITYPAGVCDTAAGACTYAPVTEPCDTPPGPTCDGDLAQTYAEAGTCAEADPACEYAPADVIDCSAQGLTCVEGVGCAQGCTDDGQCTAPPASVCDGADRVAYATPGTCEANGSCTYTETRETCPNGCFAGTCLDPASAGIAEARAAAENASHGGGPTGLDIQLTDVVVTYVVGAEGEVEGFFVQAAPEGPGLWIDTEAIWARHQEDPTFPALVLPTPGDVISLTVDEMRAHNSGMAGVADIVPVSSTLAWSTSGSVDPSTLAVDVSADSDIPAQFEVYESRLVNLTGTLTGALRSGGTGFAQWPLETAGMPDAPNHLLWRTANWIVGDRNLADGCSVTGTVPMWGNVFEGVQYAWPTAFHRSDYADITCPGPRVQEAHLLGNQELAVFFDRTLEPASVTPDAFSVSGNTVTAAAAGDRHVVLTLGAPTMGGGGTVTVAAGVTDTEGSGVEATANQASFGGPNSSVGPVNPGFESWWVPTEPALPAYWSPAAGVSVAQQTSGVHSGGYAARLTRTGTGTAQMWSTRTPAVPGESYAFGAWMLDAGADARGRVVVEFQDRVHRRLASRSGTWSADGAGWAQVVDAWTPPTGTWWVLVAIEVGTEGAAAGGVLEVDDVSIRPGAMPMP